MNKTLWIGAAAVAALLAHGAAFAQASPAGLWKTIDDKTKKERSLVRITESGGVFVGRIERRLDPAAKPDATCDKCTDDRKDKPIDGLEIIRAVKKSDGDNLWDSGTILDPEEGKTYRVRLQLADEGKRLEVRGYIGAPLLGRTQNWMRVE
ncbi:MAG: DUF2147 domain-containing protein [Ideonella sp.]|jgi:uncharacterized protein (DUF2147 family)|nr:DUF2147 domain-containing protein [Ideonella sp.]